VLVKVGIFSFDSSFLSTPNSLIGPKDYGRSMPLQYILQNTGVTDNLKTTIYRVGCATVNH